MSAKDSIPPGFTLRHTFEGHTQFIARIAWSPNGKILASPSRDGTIRLWGVETGQHLGTLGGHSGGVLSVAWSPNGQVLASNSSRCA